MKATFLCELDVDDTDLLGIAEDLKDTINANFQHACLSCKPWARPSTATILPPTQQTLPPTLGQ